MLRCVSTPCSVCPSSLCGWALWLLPPVFSSLNSLVSPAVPDASLSRPPASPHRSVYLAGCGSDWHFLISSTFFFYLLIQIVRLQYRAFLFAEGFEISVAQTVGLITTCPEARGWLGAVELGVCDPNFTSPQLIKQIRHPEY